MKTYLKMMLRMFQKHLARFFSLLAMVLISIGFLSGIGSTKDKIDASLQEYYENQNVSDWMIRSESENGFSPQMIEELQDYFGQDKDYNYGFQMDVQTEKEGTVRMYFLDFSKWTVNVPTIVKGEKQDGTDAHQIYVERGDQKIQSFEVGDKIDLTPYLQEIFPSFLLQMLDVNVEVSAVVQSPLTFAMEGEPSDYASVEEENSSFDDVLTAIFYIPKSLLLHPLTKEELLPDNAIYIAHQNRKVFQAFSRGYEEMIREKEGNFQAEDAQILTLYDNFSFQSLHDYSKKIANIGYIFMAVFLFVTILVVFSTMTRFIEEERSQIACLKTLGYSSFRIISKYLLFAFIATGIGGFGGYFVGIGITRLLYFVFSYSYDMPPISSRVAMFFYIITLIVIVGGTFFATLLSGYKMTREHPATLLRPKPPKLGKKILLEKTFLWKKLSFQNKSTIRNVVRYKSRLLMMVVSVSFSMALVLAGLGVLDLCFFHDFGSPAIKGVGFVVIAFAGLLNIIVIYTLTNINISERNREIATLMVLGYQNKEVTGYIFREIFLQSILGILCGYVISLFLLQMIFSITGVGSIVEVTWFMWLIAPIIVLLFTAFIILILRRKIIKIQMNESLKAIE